MSISFLKGIFNKIFFFELRYFIKNNIILFFFSVQFIKKTRFRFYWAYRYLEKRPKLRYIAKYKNLKAGKRFFNLFKVVYSTKNFCMSSVKFFTNLFRKNYILRTVFLKVACNAKKTVLPYDLKLRKKVVSFKIATPGISSNHKL